MDNNNTKTKIITIPNILSTFRICLIPVIIWLYCVKNENIAAGIVLVVSGVTDLADGYIARHFNMVSDVGKVLDPIADKLTQVSVLVCLLIRFPLMLIPIIFMVVKEMFMGVTGAMIIKRTGRAYSANWHGKAATFLLYATMLLHLFWGSIPAAVSTALICACSAMIAVSFVLYAKKNIEILKEDRINTGA